ncbi:MAG: hypothetical protein P0Y65_08915 [Candidatus Devosia phytovorans]|uniref:Uncharacterized protein n=1 Tax=Candidatus Devosia phytovorans TaxID=3121372 RepID=A0AAJ6B231_9HYPH|nr:hypothetical protein [Devosia sp.]WEK06351.1 MAG: hypothetical protein P0Y65_08915 [Devosia sp.]
MTTGFNGSEEIEISRRSLANWRGVAVLSKRPNEIVRLLRDEVHALEALALSQPRNAPAAAQLIAAYESLVETMLRRIGSSRPDRHAARMAG